MGALLHLFPILAVILYISAATRYVLQVMPSRIVKLGIGRRLLMLGFLLHLIFMFSSKPEFLHTGTTTEVSGAFLSFPYTLSLISSVMVGVFLLLENRLKISVLGACVVPLASFFLLGSGLLFHLERGEKPSFPLDGLLGFHILSTVVGHVAFGLAFGVSLLLIAVDSMVKHKQLGRLKLRLPSLRLLDRLNSYLLYLGFAFMVLGVLTGFVYGIVHDIPFFAFNARVVASLLTLFVYAVLLTGRTFSGIKGRRAAWLSVAGFATVLASFISVQFLGSGFHVH